MYSMNEEKKTDENGPSEEGLIKKQSIASDYNASLAVKQKGHQAASHTSRASRTVF